VKPAGLLFLAALCTAAAYGETLSVTSDADTTILVGSLPATFDGPDFVSGTTGRGSTARGLLHFDISSLPADATLDSIALTLTVVKVPDGPNGGSNFELHRVLRPWTEPDATWTQADAQNAWTNAGGDFAADATAFTMIETLGQYTFASSNLFAEVQGWFDGSVTNLGWLLLTDGEGQSRSARRFGAHEWSDPGGRPTLTINYHTPRTPPPGLLLQNLRVTDNNLEFDFLADTSHFYTVEVLDAVGGTWAELAEIVVDSPGLTTFSDPIGPGQLFYRVRVDPIP